MSYFRLYTAPDTYTDYPDIWDVSLSPVEINGASYWQTESRTASLTMPWIAKFDTLRNDPAKPPIYRAVGELWEDITYYDSSGERQTRTQLLFRGYLFQDSFGLETIGATYEGNQRIVTVTLYDYLSVLEYFLTHRWQIMLADGTKAWIGVEDTKLPVDSDILVYEEYHRLWDYVPYSVTDPAYPLWAKPPLSIYLPQYSGYGYVYENVPIFTQTGLDCWTSWYDCRLFEEDGEAYMDEVKLRLVGMFSEAGYYYHWNRYKLVGSTVLQVGGFPIVKRSTSGILGNLAHVGMNADWAINFLGADDNYNLASGWASQHQLNITQNGIPRAYTIKFDLDEAGWWVNPHTLTLTGSANYETLHTLPQDNEIQPVGWFEKTAKRIFDLVGNPAVIATPAYNPETGGPSWSVPAKDWLSFLLLLNFAWLSESGGGYLITNRLFYESGGSPYTLSDVLVASYVERYETSVESYGSGVTCIVDNDAYVAGIDAFAKATFSKYNRICEFMLNSEVPVGEYINLPEHNPNLIRIEGVEYNPAEPFRWRYTGRSM